MIGLGDFGCGRVDVPSSASYTARVSHERFMRAALEAARPWIGHTSPNPAVGAVVVRRGTIIATGAHRKAGGPHAEIVALRSAPSSRGATLYVTLEPCSTHGRTPPCTEAILAAGIRRVVVGTVDPNPAHAGRGLAFLRAAGVEVLEGILEAECRALNRGFNHWITTGRPFVVAKCGMSLDGRLTRPPGESPWLTGPAARRDARKLRAEADAVLVGAGTLRTDNPRLTVRGIPGARQPLRVIAAGKTPLPRDARVFTDAFRDKTRVFRNQSLEAILVQLGSEGVTSVLIEGGGRMLGEALDRKLVQRAVIYLAPILAGGETLAFAGLGVGCSAEAPRIRNPEVFRIGPDLRLSGDLEWPSAR